MVVASSSVVVDVHRILVAGLLALACAAWTHGTPQLAGGGPNARQQNIFGVATSVSPTNYYNPPGNGGPAISTADYYHSDGLYWFRPYDLLDSACGSAGAALAASRGRYIWMIGPDHPNNPFSWDGTAFRAGFSSDPGILPSVASIQLLPESLRAGNNITQNNASTFTASIPGSTTMTVSAVATGKVGEVQVLEGGGASPATAVTSMFAGGMTGQGGTGTYNISPSQTSNPSSGTLNNVSVYQIPFFVCNPDDASFPFYIYAEGTSNQGGGLTHQTGLARCDADLVCTLFGLSHLTVRANTWSSFQRVVRTGAGVWYSTGINHQNAPYGDGDVFGSGKYTSTDGLNWTSVGADLFNSCLPVNTLPAPFSAACPNGSAFNFGAVPDSFLVAGQASTMTAESTIVDSVRVGPQYVTRVPIGSDFGVIASPATTRISLAYAGNYPGPTYLQSVGGYIEDGVAHYYAAVGFPPSASNHCTPCGGPGYLPYLLGGGLWEQQIDYYTEIIDASAAAAASPVGVMASCAAGTATISWFNALPAQTYRVYKGTSAGTQATLVGDVAGTTTTDTPTDQAQTWYKVVTMEGSTERKNRVVHVYCSSSAAWVNAHINRVIDDGGDLATINRTWMDTVYNWMVSEDLWKSLQHWVDPAFGLKCSSQPCANGGQITVIYDFGTTKLPRGGDLRPTTANTTYQSAGLNGSTPAWVNGASNAFLLFGNGRVNNIRRKIQATFLAVFQSAGNAALIGNGEFGGIKLRRLTGNAQFSLTMAGTTGVATKAIVGCTAHVIGGTWDDATLYAWDEGIKGSAGSPSISSNPLLNLVSSLRGAYGAGIGDSAQIPILQSGAVDSKYQYTASAWPAGFVPGDNNASYTGSMLGFFYVALTDAQMTSFNSLQRTRIGAC